ncbi:hypothetical protein FHS43_003876 [Streptosporangium becharense]|uniref:Uncharacterized protein n=1 Tax=Streptosporangium becharense TaxID=1816182 RepID=A0A7W9IGX7_9ACTN|nr:DUF6461 domain-containing protein [Streptosporangium becharense]MBB2912593.1 hypothetical protein [Streptosporangium becharense]MBB5820577.1 hypothetical protein [Streptosporangium becharense]
MSVYSWLDDDAFCATHVRGLTPHEALARLGIEVVDGDDEEGEIDEGLICAHPAEGGTVLSELNGFAGTLDEVLRPLSVGTVTASVFVNVNRVADFVHYADGRKVLSFDPLIPHPTDDAQADYLSDRIELGLVHGNSEGGLAAARQLAERITGVRPNASSRIVTAHGFVEY